MSDVTTAFTSKRRGTLSRARELVPTFRKASGRSGKIATSFRRKASTTLRKAGLFRTLQPAVLGRI